MTAQNTLVEMGARVAGRYEVRGSLGAGGFAKVFSGFDVTLERDVAIKVLDLRRLPQGDASLTETTLQRFDREARLAGKIRHPNVVEIYDVGRIQGDELRPYIVMEFLKGHELGEELKRHGPLEPARGQALFLGALEALGEAHQRGIVHKDLKPANLFLVEPGLGSERLKVVDFGVAHVNPQSLASAPQAQRLTGVGQLLGTPRYLAPEYIARQHVSPALDVYQMGLILAESLSCVRIVVGNTLECIHQHIEGQLELPVYLLESPLGPLLRRALARDPGERHADAQELAEALRAIDASAIPAPPSAPSRLERAPIGGGNAKVRSTPAPQVPADRADTEIVSAAGMTDDVDQLLGRELFGYRLVDKLGEGGMALVFRGENLRDPKLQRAIKVVKPHLSRNEEFSTRFVDEGRILDELMHPNVVRFYDIRGEQGFLAMILELLEGRALSAQLEQERPSARQAIDWLIQAARGTAAAHALGIVHRDLKLENLFLTDDDQIKVLDFGIARARDAADRLTPTTKHGVLHGTADYMAPEVCEGAIPTEAADVYALGICLWELLLGHHPFVQPGAAPMSSMAIMAAHYRGEFPRLGDHRPELGEDVGELLLRATARDPGERFADASELVEALQQLRPGRAPDAKKPPFDPPPELDPPPLDPPARARRIWPVVLVAGLLVLLAGGYYASGQGPKLGSDPSIAAQSMARSDLDKAREAAAAVSVEEAEAFARQNAFVTIESTGKAILGINPSMLNLDIEKNPMHRRAYETIFTGFRPEKEVHAPAQSYQIHQHEVSWKELDRWLSRHPAQRFAIPAWVPTEPEKREDLPAVGVPWARARAFCKELGGDLPTEEQWEFAARSPALNVYPWGSAPPDPARVVLAPREEGLPLRAIMGSDQDRTGPGQDALFDMMGNALEWTRDVWRGDKLGDAAPPNVADLRAMRGYLRLLKAPGYARPRPLEGLACRNDVHKRFESSPPGLRDFVGFRCVRPVPGEPAKR